MEGLDKKCDRCGDPLGIGDPTGNLHYTPPFQKTTITLEICKGCDAELKAFWGMEGGDFAREKLERARAKSEKVL